MDAQAVKWNVCFCVFGVTLGGLVSWYITDRYAHKEIVNAKNEGVLEERGRWTTKVYAEEVTERVDAEAKSKCGADMAEVQLQCQRQESALDLKLERCRSNIAQQQTECGLTVATWKRRASEGPVKRYFQAVFERLTELAEKTTELGSQKSPGAQAVSRLNDEARSVLGAMKLGREKFGELSSALNHDAAALLQALEKGDLQIWDLRDTIAPLAKSKEEKETVMEAALAEIGAI